MASTTEDGGVRIHAAVGVQREASPGESPGAGEAGRAHSRVGVTSTRPSANLARAHHADVQRRSVGVFHVEHRAPGHDNG